MTWSSRKVRRQARQEPQSVSMLFLHRKRRLKGKLKRSKVRSDSALAMRNEGTSLVLLFVSSFFFSSFLCLAEGRKVLWPARGGDSVPFYGCGEVDEDRGGVLTMVIRWRGRKPSDYCWDLVGRPPRYANVATSEYVPTPNPSTTTEHKTLSVSEDEYTKFFQYQAAKL